MSRPIVSANEALQRLREGNRRFTSNVRSVDAMMSQSRRSELEKQQNPFAIVLSCSDSRAPSEILFDQGLGDLFVIRVAGNIAAPSQIGSIEFAAEHFGTRLVVVMGHTRCGAITATVDAMEKPGGEASRNLLSIVDRVRPSIEPLMKTDVAKDRAKLLREAVRAHVRVTADQLRHGSPVLEQFIQKDGLVVVGAEYDIATGVVDFFDGV